MIEFEMEYKEDWKQEFWLAVVEIYEHKEISGKILAATFVFKQPPSGSS